MTTFSAKIPTPYNKLKKALIVACYLFIGTACSHLEYLQLNDKQKLSHLLEIKDYQQALLLVKSSHIDNPDHQYLQEQKANITKQQRTFVYQTIHKSRQLIKKQQWPEALTLLDNASRNNLNQPVLKHELEKSLTSQQQFVLQQKTAIAKLQAQQHQPTKLLIDNLLRADPSQVSYQNLLTQSQQAASNHFVVLLQAAQQAATNKDWQQASSLINSAKQLNTNQTLLALEKSINAAISKNQQKQRSHTLNQQRLKNIRLTQALISQNKNQHWQQAQVTITLLHQQDHLSSSHKQLIEESQQALAKHINQLISQGQQHYTRGELDNAIKYWQQAQQLAPNEEDISQKLKRAKRFQENLNKLP